MVVPGTCFPMWPNFPCLIMAGPAVPTHALFVTRATDLNPEMKVKLLNRGGTRSGVKTSAFGAVQLPAWPRERLLRVSLLLAEIKFWVFGERSFTI